MVLLCCPVCLSGLCKSYFVSSWYVSGICSPVSPCASPVPSKFHPLVYVFKTVCIFWLVFYWHFPDEFSMSSRLESQFMRTSSCCVDTGCWPQRLRKVKSWSKNRGKKESRPILGSVPGHYFSLSSLLGPSDVHERAWKELGAAVSCRVCGASHTHRYSSLHRCWGAGLCRRCRSGRWWAERGRRTSRHGLPCPGSSGSPRWC